ncbi:MAG: efflux RND transporter periplasmic adaptor subunit [Planctomycetales bacterium]
MISIRPAVIAMFPLFAIPLFAMFPSLADAQAPADPKVDHCLITVLQEVEVPAHEAGVIDHMEAKEGMHVKAGQELAQLKLNQAKLEKLLADVELRSARRQAENDVNIRFAKASWEVSEAEFIQGQEANRKAANTVPPSEMRRRKLAADRAKLQIEQSRFEKDTAVATADAKQVQADVAQFRMDQRTIRSPLQGVVVELRKEAGEWVNPGDSVLRIVRLDRLRVEGFLDAAQHSPAEVDSRLVTVYVDLPGGKTEEFPGKISYVSPEVDPVSRYFRVWAEIANRGLLLRPGMPARMVIHLSASKEPPAGP